MQSIGVGIKQHELVMVALKQGVRQISLDAYRIVPLPQDLQERQEMVAHNLERFIKSYRAARDNIFVGLPRTAALVHLLLLPATVEENLRAAVGYEIDKYTPFARDEVCFDCHVLRRVTDTGLVQVLLVTVKRETIEEHLNLFKKIGIRPRGIEITTTALLNALPPAPAPQQRGELLPPLSLSRLSKASLQRFYKEKVASYFSMVMNPAGMQESPPGIDIVIECLDPTTYEVDILDAGCLCSSEVVSVMASEQGEVLPLRTLYDTGMRALIHVPYDPSRDNHPVRVLLSGKEWNDALRGREVEEIPHPPIPVQELPVTVAAKVTDVTPALVPLLSVPVGLALKGIRSTPVDINLIPPELRLKKKRSMRKVTAAGCAVLGVLGIVGLGLKTAADLRSELSVVTQEVSELKKQVRSIEALQEEARKAEQVAAAITGIRAGDISKLKLLEELTRIIPEDSFLTEFYYKAGEKKISLTGFAASASKLVPLLEESPLFDSVKFTSPITSDKRTGKERFRLEMNISSGAPPSP